LILNELFFINWSSKNRHSFVKCHLTLFKWIVWTLFEIYEYYVLYFI